MRTLNGSRLREFLNSLQNLSHKHFDVRNLRFWSCSRRLYGLAMAGRWELTGEQWELVEPILGPVRRGDIRGAVRTTDGGRAGASGLSTGRPPCDRDHAIIGQFHSDNDVWACALCAAALPG